MLKTTIRTRSIALSLCFAFTCLISTKTYAQCQTIVGTIETTPAITDSVLKICLGTKVQFSGKGTYPQNGVRYTQSDSLSTFTWSFGRTVVTGKNVTYEYRVGGIFQITLTIKDSAGCQVQKKYKAQVSSEPEFFIKPSIPLKIGDTLILTVKPELKDTHATISYTHKLLKSSPDFFINNTIKFIPDEPTQEYTMPIQVIGFESGQTLNTVSDLQQVRINMEHSWARDLEMKIICPSGKSMILHKYDVTTRHTNEIHLGIPNKQDASFGADTNNPALNPQGIGYNYYWNSSATKTLKNFFSPQTSVIAKVPANTVLKTDESFTTLLGCPLNGTWTLAVADRFKSDNGWIFNWGMTFKNFNPNTPLDSFINRTASIKWLSEHIIRKLGDTAIVAKYEPFHVYRVEITDNFGCKYYSGYEPRLDTSEYVTVKGSIYQDLDSNCVVSTPDIAQRGHIVSFETAQQTFTAGADYLGNYKLQLAPATYTVKASSLQNFPFCNDSVRTVIVKKDSLRVDFMVQQRRETYDLSIQTEKTARFRRGSLGFYFVSIKNFSGISLTNVRFEITIDTALIYRGNNLSSIEIQSLGQKIQSKPFKLAPGQSLAFGIFLETKQQTPLGTVINCPIKVESELIEKDTLNNTDILKITVVGSFDPNDKTVQYTDKATLENQVFNYTIRFQNTGTDTAFTVRVIDTLPSVLDPSTIETLAWSHNFRMEMKGNIVAWIFDPIILPDSFVNVVASNGFLNFKIKSKNPLPIGTEIKNKAAIYFDFNDPVITEYALSTVKKVLIYDTFRLLLCKGSTYKNKVYTENAAFIDILTASRTDTLRAVYITIKPTFDTKIDTILQSGRLYEGIAYKNDTTLIRRLTAVNGCDSLVTINIRVIKTRIAELTGLSAVQLSPNPTSHLLNIQYELSESMPIEITVLNMLGQNMSIKTVPTFQNIGRHEQLLDVNALINGTYFITISTPKGRVRKVFTVQK